MMPSSHVARTAPSKRAAKLRDTLKTEQRLTIKWLRQEFASDVPASLAVWHKLGLLARDLAPKYSPQDGQQRVQTYGKRRVQLLAKRIGLLPNRIYEARRFAAVYSDFDSDVAPLKDLSWLHVVELLAVKDEKQRRKFQAECLKAKWTTGKLQLEIRTRVGRQRSRGQGGRPLRHPATELEALIQLDEMLTKLIHWYDSLPRPSSDVRVSSQKPRKRAARAVFGVDQMSDELRRELVENLEPLRRFQGFVSGKAAGERERLFQRKR
jgi:hypothetical protein